MEIQIIGSLECLVSNREDSEAPIQALRHVEYQLATLMADSLGERTWSVDDAVEQLARSCREELPIALLQLARYHRPGSTVAHKTQAWIATHLANSEERQRQRAKELIAGYKVDAQSVSQVRQAVTWLDQVYQRSQIAEATWMQTCRPANCTGLFARSVFRGLTARWNQDECDEPLLWRVGDMLDSLARDGSLNSLTEALHRLVAFGLLGVAARDARDSLRDFIVLANDDANGNLLDNLVAAERTYRDLLADGWQPDRWEVENLPITISLLLRFMAKAGIQQSQDAGQRLRVTLDQAQSDFRYLGSPFLEGDECKDVVVQAPGWTYQGQSVVRPKVQEVAS